MDEYKRLSQQAEQLLKSLPDNNIAEGVLIFSNAYYKHKEMYGSFKHLIIENNELYHKKMKERLKFQLDELIQYKNNI